VAVKALDHLVRNHARSVLTSDFFVVVTASLRIHVVLEVATRRRLHSMAR